jgi:shikimate dehydrogenase
VRQAAVLGRPVGHSLSPVLHRAAYASLGLDWTYEAIDCGVDDLRTVLDARAGWAGFSCTMPLKRALLDIAAEVDDLARIVGAANTLTPVPDGWRAWSTDVEGIVVALSEHDVLARSAVLLGAGGTAQNALAALVSLGVGRVDVLVRDIGRSAELRECADRLGVDVQIDSFEDGDLDADLVVSTLPRGAADQFAARPWRAAQVLLDVVYDPWPTELSMSFTRNGAAVISGASMLLHQAAAQVRLMTGYPAPVEAMRVALLAAAPGCAA